MCVVTNMNADCLMMLTGMKGANSDKGKGNDNFHMGAQVSRGSGTAIGAAQEQPAVAAQPMTDAQVDRGMLSSGTAVGAAQMQPAAVAHPMTGAHNDVRTQCSGDGAGKHKRKANTAQPGEGSPPAMQRLQERHDLSQEPPNSAPCPCPCLAPCSPPNSDSTTTPLTGSGLGALSMLWDEPFARQVQQLHGSEQAWCLVGLG
jgi:hypothetical protein